MHEWLVYILLFISLYFLVFVLLVFIEKRGEIFSDISKLSKLPKKVPFVTIMVPVFNEEKTLTRTIESLLALSYPKNKFEILIIDDGSTDNTKKIMESFTHHPCIRALYKENGGKYTALNYGLEHARGEIIGCLDADSYVEPDALLHIVDGFRDENVMSVIPAIKIGEAKTILQHTQAVEYILSLFMRKAVSLLDAVFVTPGPFSFFRKEVFDIVGPYKHAHNTEDLEICLRMQERHMKIINAHHAVVYTISPATLKALYKQRVRWTYGFLRNIKDYYRSFFFNPRHGNLGLFILPMSTIAIYSAIYFGIALIVNTGLQAYGKVQEYMATGLYFNLPSFDFNWFYINTSTPIIISMTLIVLVFCVLYAGLQIGKEKFRISRGLIFYTFVYGFIATAWLISASIKALLAKKPSWR